jgi:broad-specificity NMP kinase
MSPRLLTTQQVPEYLGTTPVTWHGLLQCLPVGDSTRGARCSCRVVTLFSVSVVLVTGMSGTGKSTALAELARRGHRVVDTDHGGFAVEVPSSAGRGSEQLWREDRIDALLREHVDGVLFVSGCVANQGKFYPRFDAVVLLSAAADVILERVAARETNDFGKAEVERDRILADLAAFEPQLRAGATAEIDTRAPLAEVVDALERVAVTGSARVTPTA